MSFVACTTSQHLSRVTTSQVTTCHYITCLHTAELLSASTLRYWATKLVGASHHIRWCVTSPNSTHNGNTTRRNSPRIARTRTSVWASPWLVTLCTFYRQILSLTYSFFSLKLPPPACPALLVHGMFAASKVPWRNEVPSNELADIAP